MQVKECMTTSFRSLQPNSSFRKAIESFDYSKTDIAPVVDDNRVVGVVTKYTVYRCMLRGISIDDAILPHFIREVVAVSSEDDLAKARETLIQAGVAHAVVVEPDGKIAGVLGKSDIIRGFHLQTTGMAEQMSSLINHMHNGLIAVNRDGAITVCNPAAARMIGAERNKLIGGRIRKLIPGLEPALQTACELAHPYPVERLQIGKSIVFATCTPIIEDNPAGGAMAVLQDITEYEQVAKELETTKKLEETLQTVLNLAFDGLAVCDRQGTLTMANTALAELVQRPQSALIGTSVHSILQDLPLDLDIHQEQEHIEPRFINGKQCIVTSRPIVRSGQAVGTIVKVTYRSLSKWKNVIQRLENLQKELSVMRGKLAIASRNEFELEDIITVDERMVRLKEQAQQIAPRPSHVLLTGESGTGKELFARGIHTASGRPGRFIKVNCAAIPDSLLESELFGYADGAYTGAKRGGKAGKFELADNGTFFLDEIGDMPLALQAKLLHVIQEREFERVGSNETIRVNARIIAATNRNLEQMVRDGLFRADLYYRLNVVNLSIPPVRERTADIPALARALLKRLNDIMGLQVETISPDAMLTIQRYGWPGNVRELENAIEHALNFCSGSVLEVQDLPEHIQSTRLPARTAAEESLGEALPFTDTGTDRSLPSLYRRALGDTEKEVIRSALRVTGGNRAAAARILGISRSQFYKKLAVHGLEDA